MLRCTYAYLTRKLILDHLDKLVEFIRKLMIFLIISTTPTPRLDKSAVYVPRTVLRFEGFN